MNLKKSLFLTFALYVLPVVAFGANPLIDNPKQIKAGVIEQAIKPTLNSIAASTTTLGVAIATETANRIAADSTLQGNINAEAATRSAADLVHDGRLNALDLSTAALAGGLAQGALQFQQVAVDTTTLKGEIDAIIASTGTLGDAKLAADQTFTGINQFTNPLNTFYGDGSNLTGVSASDPTKLPLTGGTLDGQLNIINGWGINLTEGDIQIGGNRGVGDSTAINGYWWLGASGGYGGRLELNGPYVNGGVYGPIVRLGDPQHRGTNFIATPISVGHTGAPAVGVSLDVVGGVKINDGTQAAGYVLTSDANGVASWQAASGGGIVEGSSPTWTGEHFFHNNLRIENGYDLQIAGGGGLRQYGAGVNPLVDISYTGAPTGAGYINITRDDGANPAISLFGDYSGAPAIIATMGTDTINLNPAGESTFTQDIKTDGSMTASLVNITGSGIGFSANPNPYNRLNLLADSNSARMVFKDSVTNDILVDINGTNKQVYLYDPIGLTDNNLTAGGVSATNLATGEAMGLTYNYLSIANSGGLNEGRLNPSAFTLTSDGVTKNIELSNTGYARVQGASASSSTLTAGALEVVAENTAAAIRTIAYGSGPSLFSGSKARGTAAAPTALLLNDPITIVNSRGYDGSNFSSIGRAAIRMVADENWAVGSEGTRMEFWVSSNTTTTNIQALTIKNNGFVGVGTTIPQYKMDINGDMRVLGTTHNKWERITNTCLASTTCSAVCSAGNKLTGGGCSQATLLTSNGINSASADDTWSCSYLGATDITATAICAAVDF